MHRSSVEDRAKRTPKRREDGPSDEILRALAGWAILTLGMAISLATRWRNPHRQRADEQRGVHE